MTTIDLPYRADGLDPATQTTAPVRTATPVRWWAALGALVLSVQLYAWGRWATSERFEATTMGRDEVPGWMELFAGIWTWTMFAGMIWLFWYWLWRPMRREGRMTIEGKLLVIWLLLYWQDPLGLWTQNWFSYNSALINMGSWTTDVPGWFAPVSNRLGEPFLWVASSYVFVLAPATVWGAYVMRRAKARWPSIGKLGLIMVAFGTMAVADVVAETIWVRFGLYSYGGAVRSMSLFSGNYYQFPIYESFMWGAAMAAFSSVIYFRNDKGETVAERRSEDLRLGATGKVLVRFLALLAIFNVIYGSYNFSMQWFGLRADDWTEDHYDRPYLLQGLCGPGSEYACGAPDVPIAREHSVHLGPDGELVVPEEVTIRDESRIEQ
ncbi:MAG TPA: spirocyclase AveC family protein [Acidimicrobiales bacterium]